ncbi:UNVERIFIED_CONTAM: hypothetical protein Sangu_1157100 [Sesamum angustifolium]|uniref:Uncharacterized protein n=1 Tax=Sesamum angustifolium TaxID=2727405 RepID=A0AAW2P1I3_9LAMI
MPTLEEVREAVFSIDPDSVAGPDGFGAVFFHTCWEIIAEDVFGAVTEFFRGGRCRKALLLQPSPSFQRRPAPLAGVNTGRLAYSGFVPGRLLSDNVLLAQELIHTLESHRPDANVVFKLDMAKAMIGSVGSSSIKSCSERVSHNAGLAWWLMLFHTAGFRFW